MADGQAEKFENAESDYDGDAILIVDDDVTSCKDLQTALAGEFKRVYHAESSRESLVLARSIRFDALIINADLNDSMSAAELTRRLRSEFCTDMLVVFLSDSSHLAAVLSSLQDVDGDFLRKPFHVAELLAVLRRAYERRRIERENILLQRATDQRPICERVVGESAAIKEVWRVINRIAPAKSPVLIEGDTGTGKELAARALHDLSGRKGNYVAVNCAAISADLIESELFGHVKGAFTGALQTRQGLFCLADGGTLLLDEIGELPLAMQAKLLRVLEQKTYRPVGGNKEITTNARIVTATNRDLAKEVTAGNFRQDLLYRINVVNLRIPPLRERKSDISRLTRLYLHILAVELGVPTPPLDPWDLEAMMRYDWPGNIRELRNVIERSLLLGKSISHFIPLNEEHDPAGREPCQIERSPCQINGYLKQREEAEILKTLAEVNGNKSAAARILGVSRKTIERKLKRMSVNGIAGGVAASG